MNEIYKEITSGVPQYLLFLVIILVTTAAFISICKSIIECIGEQLVKVVIAFKSQVVLKVNSSEESKD